jgi:hypothetical protein
LSPCDGAVEVSAILLFNGVLFVFPDTSVVVAILVFCILRKKRTLRDGSNTIRTQIKIEKNIQGCERAARVIMKIISVQGANTASGIFGKCF